MIKQGNQSVSRGNNVISVHAVHVIFAAGIFAAGVHTVHVIFAAGIIVFPFLGRGRRGIEEASPEIV